MKALSIWQPWASLISVGAKRYETRSWPTRYRGPIAIHAAMHWDEDCANVFSWAGVQKLLARSTYKDPPIKKCELPFGMIVAVAVLADCVKTEELISDLTLDERVLGDFSPRRFAWRIDRVERLLHPIPCTGFQGLWTVGPIGNRMERIEDVLARMRSSGLIGGTGNGERR